MKRIVWRLRWKFIYYDRVKKDFSINIYNKDYVWKSIDELIEKINKDIRKREEEEFDEVCYRTWYFWEFYGDYYD